MEETFYWKGVIKKQINYTRLASNTISELKRNLSLEAIGCC